MEQVLLAVVPPIIYNGSLPVPDPRTVKDVDSKAELVDDEGGRPMLTKGAGVSVVIILQLNYGGALWGLRSR